jgi:hypothetical protein
MEFKKKNKVYFRDGKGNLRNLDKASFKLYDYVMHYFLKSGGAAMYSHKNKDVKDYKQLQGLRLELDEGVTELLKELTGALTLDLFYNASWRPLCTLVAFKNK